MPEITTGLSNALTNIMGVGGISTTVNIISYTIPSGSYDDYTTQTLTGSQVVSGLLFPMRGTQGSQEALLMQQGKLLTKDKLLYTGSVNTSGNILISIGNDNYSVIPDGIQNWEVGGQTIYNKFYLRYSIPGSLY